MIGFQNDSVEVIEGEKMAMLTVAVMSGNVIRDEFVTFTTSKGTATGEMRGRKRFSISIYQAICGAHHY